MNGLAGEVAPERVAGLCLVTALPRTRCSTFHEQGSGLCLCELQGKAEAKVNKGIRMLQALKSAESSSTFMLSS